MAQQINRQQKLKSIQAQIKQAETYMKMEQNPYAKNRIDSLSKNPCLSGKFYLNAVFKDTQTVASEEEAVNYATTSNMSGSYQEFFDTAYIIYPEFWSKDKIEQVHGLLETTNKIQSLIQAR